MFQQVHLLFVSGTIEDDRDALVLHTICQLIEQNQKAWRGFTLVEVTNYCLGVSIDAIYAALPVTMGTPTRPSMKPALTIYELIASLNRLTSQYLYIRNDDEFEVIHLHRQLLHDLNRALNEETERIAAKCNSEEVALPEVV